MSYNGLSSPLELNTQSALAQNQGLNVSTVASSQQGFWTPSNYTQGSLTQNSVLYYLTASLQNLYNLAANRSIVINVYRNAIKIGRPINQINDDRINCPALGNSRPDSFQTSYAGWGSWSTVTVDQYYNITGSGPYSLTEPVYPPKNYPVSGDYSYVYTNWGSKTAGPYQYSYQWNQPYSWVTGWPGRNSWQEEDDSYSAAYFPRPDIRTRDFGVVEYDEYFSNGFIGTVARQAYYEIWYDYLTRRLNQYPEFIKSFQQCYQWYNGANQEISSFVNTKTFVRGLYSNINDLTTADISGVSLSFKLWGNDLIALGKSLDLSRINEFGLPSVLLKTLNSLGALTEAVKFALLLNNFSTSEISDILTPGYILSVAQENRIYSSFTIISGSDLDNIKIILNCSTPGIQTLADLLDLKRMFPNSYLSLTVPQYTLEANSSKIYDFIYTRGGANTRIPNWGDYLVGILHEELQKTCGAFMMSMSQIKNIRSMGIEQFAQVVANLEVTNKDLNLINNPGTPGDPVLANQALALSALGSGNNGTYRMCDFFGAVSGIPYTDYYSGAIPLINELATDNLRNVYEKIYQKSLYNNWELISAGKGWQDTIINPSPTWSAEYAYTLFTTQQEQYAGDSSVTAQLDLTLICTSGRQLGFESDPTAIYTITGSSFSGGQTTISFSPTLPANLPMGTKLYLRSTEYDSYPKLYMDALTGATTFDVAENQSSVFIPGTNLTIGTSNTVYTVVNSVSSVIFTTVNLTAALDGDFTTGTSVYPQNPALNLYPNGPIQNLIDAANLEILRITQNNPAGAAKLNYYWSEIGRQLFIEQRAIPYAVPTNDNIFVDATKSFITSFTSSIQTWALETEYGGPAPILERIGDITTIGGQSLIGYMRETRNARRLLNTFGQLDNSVPNELNPEAASAEICQLNTEGGVETITVTFGGWGYDISNPPNVRIGPYGGSFGGSGSGATAIPVIENSRIIAITVTNSGSGYTLVTGCLPVYIDPPPSPVRLGDSIVPGSFAGSPFTNQFPVSDNLVTANSASYTVDQAIETVTICNCDCWNT